MAKFARQWTAEEAADIINAHVGGESARSIARRYDCAASTVTRLLRAPDIAPIVAEVAAKRDAQADAEQEQAERDRARVERLERDRIRKKRDRDIARDVRQGVPEGRAREMHGKPPPAKPKRGVLSGPIVTFDLDPATGGYRYVRSYGGGTLATGDGDGFEAFLDRRDREREAPHAHPVTVRTPGLTCGLFLASEDAYDKQDIVDRVNDISDELGLSRNVVIEHIYKTPPGGTCVFAPEPESFDILAVPTEEP